MVREGLRLRFFGAPVIERDGRPVSLDRRKAEALLAYLVVEGRSHRRAELAALFWPEQSPAQARSALRRTLFALSGAIGRHGLEANRDTIVFAPGEPDAFWCDVHAFETSLRRAEEHCQSEGALCDLCLDSVESAVSLHGADFLSGLTLRDAPAFDEWQHVQMERYRELRARALDELVRYHLTRGAYHAALGFARELVRQDPLDESFHASLLTTLMAAGRRGAALRLYESFARRLEHELGIAPPDSMRELLFRPSSRRFSSTAPVAFVAFEASSMRPANGTEGLAVTGHLDEAEAAWRSICRGGEVDAIDAALDSLHELVDRSGFYREGLELLELALGVVEAPPLVGRLLARQGVLYACIGRLDQARALIAAGLSEARGEGSPTELAYCQNRLGSVLYAQGHYARGRKLLRASVENYRKAVPGAREGLSWALNVWGHLSIGTRDARVILTESLERAARAEDEQRVASTLNSLGKEALARRDFTAAERELKKSLERRESLQHRIGIADALTNLGQAYLGLGRTRAARGAFVRARDIALHIGTRPLLVEILLGLAELSAAENENERAVELAAAALHTPGGWHDARQRARAQLDVLTAGLAENVAVAAREKGRRAGLEELM